MRFDDQHQHSVLPICLPFGPFFESLSIRQLDKVVTSIGWRTYNIRNKKFSSCLKKEKDLKNVSTILKKFELFLRPLDFCVQAFKGKLYYKLWYKQICALSNDMQCTGDSGGPIQRLIFNFRTVQLGIISFGRNLITKKNNYNDTIGVYTNVAYYVPWILDQMQY